MLNPLLVVIPCNLAMIRQAIAKSLLVSLNLAAF